MVYSSLAVLRSCFNTFTFIVLNYGLLNIDKIYEEPGVGGTGLDVVVVVEGGVEDGTKVIYPSGPAPKATWEQSGGAVLIVQILHGCAELVDGVLAAPV